MMSAVGQCISVVLKVERGGIQVGEKQSGNRANQSLREASRAEALASFRTTGVDVASCHLYASTTVL